MPETRFHQRSALYVGLLYFKSYVGGQTFFRWSAVEVWRGVPTRVSSSSDRGSKLRGSSQNSPRIASKRDVNITQVTQLERNMYLKKWMRKVCAIIVVSSNLADDRRTIFSFPTKLKFVILAE
ncbi:hypothetical protein AVEN_186755-1 [Araneus ventricosus]|uniref:Uncharacterized protein n=1 Tax=Araneus ventricosus TaxID=182803 RepID=A0A4Y2Q6R0_ARAVE|nr:hypothetical protein AVEN_186755-1 [Araneus ventricosus]